MSPLAAVGSPVILASASSARAALLGGAGIPHDRIPAAVDEGAIKDEARAAGSDAGALACTLAKAKALAVSEIHLGRLVIGGDQVLECDGQWFDKPPDRRAAAEQLRFLRSRTHRLISALAVAEDGVVLWQCRETADLTMRPFGDTFLAHYLDTAGPEILESVGAYRLEGPGAQLFARIEGDYFTILGLPLLPLLAFLRDRGILRT